MNKIVTIVAEVEFEKDYEEYGEDFLESLVENSAEAVLSPYAKKVTIQRIDFADNP